MDDSTEAPIASPEAAIALGRVVSKPKGSRHRPDFRIVFANGVELEITNAHSPGHARSVAVDYMRRQRRDSGAIVSTETLPFDPRRHKARLQEAKPLAVDPKVRR